MLGLYWCDRTAVPVLPTIISCSPITTASWWQRPFALAWIGSVLDFTVVTASSSSTRSSRGSPLAPPTDARVYALRCDGCPSSAAR